jgi:hypothetical protein
MVMHRGHEHEQANGGGGSGTAPAVGPGHNRQSPTRKPAQWQLLHGDVGPAAGDENRDGMADLDLVAAAFVEGFLAASDPTSFLRLAKVPFEAIDADGAKLALLRVEIDAIADVGSITPHLGGASFRYDPLPSRMVSRRQRLRLVYFDGQGLRGFDLADAMKLSAA